MLSTRCLRIGWNDLSAHDKGAAGGDAGYGARGPRNGPTSRAKELHGAFASGLAEPETKSGFANQGLLPRKDSPQRMRKAMCAELAGWVRFAETNPLQLKQDRVSSLPRRGQSSTVNFSINSCI